jgi:pimeloyl-ACP methyl ester carboxylesterase
VLGDDALASISMPLKVVLGDRDIFFNADAAAHRIRALVPHADVLRIPAAGHGLADPTSWVLEFLAG